jgi:hypothetical protein
VGYWLTRDPPDQKGHEYQPLLLLTRVPVAELADYAELFRMAEKMKPQGRRTRWRSPRAAARSF